MKKNFIEKWTARTHYEMYPLEKEFMMQLLNNTPDFKLALEKDMTKKFYDDEKARLTGKIDNSCKNLFIGKPGSGKSYSAGYLYVFQMETMGSEISIQKHFAFDKSTCQAKLSIIIKEFTGEDLEAFINSGKLVRIKISMNQDEDTIPHGKGSITEKDIQENIEKTTRQAQINFNWCTPTITSHICDCIIRIFAINFEDNLTIGFLLNPETLKPIGVVTFGLPSDNFIGQYEKEKNKYLIRAGKGEFGGNRSILRKQIMDDLIAENYDVEAVRKKLGIGTLSECENKRQEMMIIEEVAAGRISSEENKDVYELIAIEEPSLDLRHKRRKKDEN